MEWKKMDKWKWKNRKKWKKIEKLKKKVEKGMERKRNNSSYLF